MYKSKLRNELRWKYVEKKLRIYVLIGVMGWIGYIWQCLNALEYLSYQKIVIFN